MPTNENGLEMRAITDLPEDKQILLKKLSSVFGPETAIDFVCPKTYEAPKHGTIEELKYVNCEQPEERLQRLRSMEHYQTTTQSLSRADLEASYQAFVRGQVGHQKHSRDELEQFVRNSADIDSAKRYLDSSHDISLNPLQSQLLFHSSKLNEQRANLLKSASSTKSLKQLNDNLSLHNYFPDIFSSHSKTSHKKKEIIHNKQNYSRPRLMHVEHGDKKYRITFLKDSNTLEIFHKPSYNSINNRNLFLMDQKNIESLFDTESSTGYGLSATSNTSNIHRETFPPLSLSALKEYRPTLTPKSLSSSSSSIHTQKQYSPHRKLTQKTDFIWEQSIVSPKQD